MKKHWHKRHIEEAIMQALMVVSFAVVAGSLILILWTVVSKGLPALSWQMLTQTPKGGYYLGKEGGILNAIVGSLYLAGGGTLLALVFSLPMALYIETYARNSDWGRTVRLALDVLWGIPLDCVRRIRIHAHAQPGAACFSIGRNLGLGLARTAHHDARHGRSHPPDAA